MTTLCPNMVRPTSPPPHFGVGLLVCDMPRRLAGTQTAALSGFLLSSELRLEELREHHSVFLPRPPAPSVCQRMPLCEDHGSTGSMFQSGRSSCGEKKNTIEAAEGCVIKAGRNQAHWFPWGWMNGSNASSFFSSLLRLQFPPLPSRPRAKPIRWPPIV